MSKYSINHSLERGFTLVELLAVLAIIGMLSSIVLIAVAKVRVQEKNTQRKENLVQLRTALELYYLDHGAYPKSGKCGSLLCWRNSNNYDNNDWIPGLVPKYIPSLPQEPDAYPDTCDGGADPDGTSYRYKSDGKMYKVMDHCPPISSGVRNTPPSDPFYDCDPGPIETANGNPGHEHVWSIWGGTPTQPWCEEPEDD